MEKPEPGDDGQIKPDEMDSASQVSALWRMGPFMLDPQRRELCRDGVPVGLERKALEVLLFLVRHSDGVVTKDALWQQIWKGRELSESVIPQAVGKARKALEEHGDWIATVHGVGYRFSGPVEAVTEDIAPASRSAGVHRGWLAIPVLAAIAAMVVFALSSEAPTDPSRIAVLPFVNLSTQPHLDYFGDGVADELLHELSALEELQVASRTSSFQFRPGPNGRSADVREIGRQLKVRYVVEGTVRLANEQFRMAVRLTDASTGYQVWSGVFEGPWEDILTTQRSLTRAVIEQIRPQLLPQYSQNPGIASNPQAYELYLRGRHLWHKRDPESINVAMELFRQAVQLQSDFAMAYTGLAECYLTLAVYGDLKPEQAYDEAWELLSTAIDLAPGRAETRMALGNLHALRTDWKQAEAELKTAVAINPNLAMAQMSLGNVYNELGQIQNAYERFRIALQLNPLHATISLNLAQASLKLGMLDRSRLYLDRADELAPEHTFLFGFRTVVHVSGGDSNAAATQLDTWLEQRVPTTDDSGPDNLNQHIACAMLATFLDRPQQVIECVESLLAPPSYNALGAQYLLLVLNSLGWAEARLGNVEESERAFMEALDSALLAQASQPNSEILAYEHAVALAGLGQAEAAVDQLERSVNAGRRDLGLMRHDKRLDVLRDHVDFQTLLHLLEVEQAQMRAEVLGRFSQPGV